MKNSICILAAGLILSSLGASRPKYTFLFIGDGMSTPQRMVAEEFSEKSGHGPLAMNALPYQASTRTKSANAIITDSAAAATAIACGEKTNNGMLGVTPDGRRIESVAEVAKAAGQKVGIITTVAIVHATPAGFYAHRANRGASYQIALDLIASGFDYFAGAGVYDRYDLKQDPEYRGNVFDLARQAGYTLATNRAEWAAIAPGGKSWSIFDVKALQYSIDADGSQPTLAEMLAKGIEVLDNPGGFFIMCEGGKVDYCAHANDAATTLRDVTAMDDAVKVALAFAEKHPNETLVVTTGDHETGGLSMGFVGTGGKFKVEYLAAQKHSVEWISELTKKMLRENLERPFSNMIPILEENFGFVFDKKSTHPLKVTDAELKELKKAFEDDRERVRRKMADTTAQDAPRKYVFGRTANRILAAHAGIGWSSGSHTALPTLTTAQGPGAEILVGMKENADLGQRLKKLLKP